MSAWKGNTTNNAAPNPLQESSNLSDKKIGDNRAYKLRRDVDKRKNFSITIKDVDETVLKGFQNLQLFVIDDGARINVPIMYASPERFKAMRSDAGVRDFNGKIQCPIIVFSRKSSEQDSTMPMFNKYLRYSVAQLYSTKNKYTRFSKLMGQNAPVNEIYNIVMPDHLLFTYQVIIWTEYVEQMNSLIERINFEINDYWGSSTGFRFRVSVDSYSHTTEVNNGEDRLVRTEFNLLVNGYLLPETYAPGLDGFKSTMEKSLTPKKVIITSEVVSTDFDWNRLNNNGDKWKSQQYPNLQKDELNNFYAYFSSISSTSGFREPGISVPLTPAQKWHTPPNDLIDPGEEGWKAYNNDYYYLYTGARWHNIPMSLFDDIAPVGVPAVEGNDTYDSDYYYVHISGNWKRVPLTLMNTFY